MLYLEIYIYYWFVQIYFVKHDWKEVLKYTSEKLSKATLNCSRGSSRVVNQHWRTPYKVDSVHVLIRHSRLIVQRGYSDCCFNLRKTTYIPEVYWVLSTCPLLSLCTHRCILRLSMAWMNNRQSLVVEIYFLVNSLISQCLQFCRVSHFNSTRIVLTIFYLQDLLFVRRALHRFRLVI